MESLSESYLTFKNISRVNGVTEDIMKAIISGIRKNNDNSVDEKKLSQNKNTV